MHGVLDLLKRADVTPPVVGYELTQGVRVVAEAALAWPERKVCVAVAEFAAAFSDEGWKITEFAEAIADPNTLLDKLKIE